MALIDKLTGWHSNQPLFKTDVLRLSGKKFTDFPIYLTKFPKKFPPYINLNCDFFFQEKVNTCGDASIQMLASFQMLHFGTSSTLITNLKSINSLLSKKRGMLTGLLDDDMHKVGMNSVNLPHQIRNNMNHFCSWVAYALCYLGPLITTINICYGKVPHAVVIKGVENQTLLIHDPWRGANQYIHYKNFIKIFPEYCEDFLYLPNIKLNKIYPSRESDTQSIKNVPHIVFFVEKIRWI